MMQSERLGEILLHIRAASSLAEREAREGTGSQVAAEMEEIALAFDSLTANLLYAGMQLRPGNEILIRLTNAVSEALARPI